MTTFTLDTSGAVVPLHAGKEPAPHLATIWSDLSPFEQGYVEAVFASGIAAESASGLLLLIARNKEDGKSSSRVGFSDLAPETLAAIRKDCAAYIGTDPDWAYLRDMPGCGAEFWRNRQRGVLPGFPPLIPSLGDDGKVYLREAGR